MEEATRDELIRLIDGRTEGRLRDEEVAAIADEALEIIHRRIVGDEVYIGTGSLTLAEITERLGL